MSHRCSRRPFRPRAHARARRKRRGHSILRADRRRRRLLPCRRHRLHYCRHPRYRCRYCCRPRHRRRPRHRCRPCRRCRLRSHPRRPAQLPMSCRTARPSACARRGARGALHAAALCYRRCAVRQRLHGDEYRRAQHGMRGVSGHASGDGRSTAHWRPVRVHARGRSVGRTRPHASPGGVGCWLWTCRHRILTWSAAQRA